MMGRAADLSKTGLDTRKNIDNDYQLMLLARFSSSYTTQKWRKITTYLSSKRLRVNFNTLKTRQPDHYEALQSTS